MTDPEFISSDEHPYTILVGGVHILKDGRPYAHLAPVACYPGLSHKHLVGFEGFLGSSEKMQAAMTAYGAAAAEALIEFGVGRALQSGKLTQEDLEELLAMKAQAEK